MKEGVNMEILGLQIDIRLNWPIHIDKLIRKLRGTCCALGSVFHVSSTDSQISLVCPFLFYTEAWDFLEAFYLTAKRCSLCQRKLLD
jgi:hypothetical protein